MIAKIVVHVANRPTLAAGMSWGAALETIDVSARKLGYEMPFMGASPRSLPQPTLADIHLPPEESLKVISDVLRVVEVADGSR